MKTETLQVPGAQLYYEVQGSGPVLVMIPGGPTDAGIFAAVTHLLADRYTVVAYDPRGNSRSVPDDPTLDQDMDVHGDDAAALIAALGGEPVYVLGSSGGAQIGLNLTARHPSLVRTLVAHEPPCITLLPDADEVAAGMREVEAAYRREGVPAGMKRFEELIGVGGGEDAPPQQPSTPEQMEMFGRIGGNLDFFLGHGITPLSGYRPDVEALRSGSPRIVVGIGETTEGQLARRTAIALAEWLGSEPVVFAGDHGGFTTVAGPFAAKLDEVLRG
ncbi:alpha/beta fold hydrolase [Nonomuraea mangrovi]|uniref:Alpha/beta fold hydrolase n=1 Tax=Nonomuraea mangrovi TaxID=2316207 RepID=A0ABW4SZY7_9ACTN